MKNLMILGLFLFCAMVSAKDLQSELDDVLGVEPEVRINLGAGMLGLAQLFAKDDEEASKVLSGLKGLQVTVYELEDDHDAAEDVSLWLKSKAKSLSRKGMEEIVRVMEDDEQVHIFAKIDGKLLSDLTLMVYEAGSEFVYITMDGEIDFNDIQDITGNFDIDIDGLDNIQVKL
ncbi:DUF4252 domain-containing protein [Marinicella rhabdoformis]|uniref:DUF4252 domain-containing protein n=1 Tax=Marinicella rhabdoformis TaxID=2580566 RepID=UPI0012AEC627|nr:DUF4252 domain-containing protein [Marinicella rhabdoformis]